MAESSVVMWRERVFKACAAAALWLLAFGALLMLPLPPSKAPRLWARVTGGRPMQRLERPPAFTSDNPDARLAYWLDAYGRAWLAPSAWSRFRIRVEEYDA